jgi:hypothetical protein
MMELGRGDEEQPDRSGWGFLKYIILALNNIRRGVLQTIRYLN